MSSSVSGGVPPPANIIQINQLQKQLDSLHKDEGIKKVEHLIKKLIKDYERSDKRIMEYSKAALDNHVNLDDPTCYINPDNPTYQLDLEKRSNLFKKIAKICKKTWNWTITQ